MVKLSAVFTPKSVAVVGASRQSDKVGHVVLQSLLSTGFKGKIFPVNPKAKKLLGLKCYSSVSSIPQKIDAAVIAVPSHVLLDVVTDCGISGVKGLIVLTAGLSEVGNKSLEMQLLSIVRKYNMCMIGPNCLGILETHHKFDTIFLPVDRMLRPKPGNISFICQSGAVGSTTLDYMAANGYSISHFISYGNATDINECDLIEYASQDPNTKVICLYIEAVRQGKRFLKLAKSVTQKKPIIALKGGTTSYGTKAALSHTASLAGDARIYTGVFNQCNIIQANSIEELFDYARIFTTKKAPKGRRIQIITDGGGFGILAADQIEKNHLTLSRLTVKNERFLKRHYPGDYVVHNPIDLTGAATEEDYAVAIETCSKDPNVDIILVIMLFQTPRLTISGLNKVIEVIEGSKKPVFFISAGSYLTEKFRNMLSKNHQIIFDFPDQAANAISKWCNYYKV